MKIRLGFVSNSSSASYYIRLIGSKENRNKAIFNAIDYLDWDGELKERIKDNIKYTKASIARLEQKTDKFLFETKEELEDRLEDLEKDLRYLEQDRNYERKDYVERLIEISLRWYGIGIKVYENETRLESFTTMHNNYTEGTPRIFQELILKNAFEPSTDLKIEQRVDKRG